MANMTPSVCLVTVPLEDRPVRWRIGLVTLSSDPTIEHSFMRMLAGTNDVAIHTAQVKFNGDISVDNLKSMESDIRNAASNILPGQSIDAILYGCTSASAAIGDDKVRALLADGKPCAAASAHTPVSAALAAFRRLGVQRLSVIAPYPSDVTEMLAKYLQTLGLEVVALTCLGLEQDMDNGRVSVDTLCKLATDIDHKDADAIFLSCTALRGAEAAERIEQITGKPVVTSNQVLLWHGLRQAGCDLKIEGFGRILRL